MSIDFKTEYTFPENLADDYSQDLTDLYSNARIGDTILDILGSYWGAYYKDLPHLHVMAGAVTALIGEQFQDILHYVLSSSVVDIPVNYFKRHELFAFNSKDATYVYSEDEEQVLRYVEFPYPGLEGIQFLSSGLFNSDIILDSDNYFSVEDGKIKFYIDIFNNSDIRDGAYVFETFDGQKTEVKVVLLWASAITVTQTYLYDRFGKYLYHRENNSESYKAALAALQFFYTTTKSVHNLENVLNILFKMPFSRKYGEIVEKIDSFNGQGDTAPSTFDYNVNAAADSASEMQGLGWFHRVVTSHNTYFVPMFAELLVSQGDVLTDYQLIGRVHRVKDYVSDPDWYSDSRFPFELVTHLDDPSALTTIPEFAMYRPQKFDGTSHYDGSFVHTGKFATYGGINPFLGTRSRESGTEFEQFLYGLMDSVLKFNLIYVQTNLNYENFLYYKDSKVFDAYQAISSGVPVYLYPVMETAFHSDLIDSWDSLDDEEVSHLSQELGPEAVVVCPDRCYDGSVRFSNSVYFTYAGGFSYDGKARFYPYGGPGRVLHDCKTDDFGRTLRLEGTEDLYPEITEELNINFIYSYH